MDSMEFWDLQSNLVRFPAYCRCAAPGFAYCSRFCILLQVSHTTICRFGGVGDLRVKILITTTKFLRANRQCNRKRFLDLLETNMRAMSHGYFHIGLRAPSRRRPNEVSGLLEACVRSDAMILRRLPSMLSAANFDGGDWFYVCRI